MKTVYVVTKGEYSDYGICAIFSTKELAEEYVRTLNELQKGAGEKTYYETMQIEEYGLDMPPSESFWIVVSITREGNTRTLVPTLSWVRSEPYIHKDTLTISVNTDSIERAVKVANEYRTRLLALGQWKDGTAVI